MSLKRPRGQAVVEAALGIFVFVTLLVFGIHFAEMGQVGLKVAEAANAAMWDSTSQQMHDVTAHTWNQYQTAPAIAAATANARYTDFDALRSSGSTVTQVFTRAEQMKVDCRTLAVADGLNPADPDPLAANAYPTGDRGIVCGAQAVLSGFRIPKNFLDGNLSEVQHYRPLTLPVCAVGRPSQGACPGKLGMLLDDWGYTGQLEARECALAWEGGSSCANQGYYDQANSVYQATPVQKAGSASRLATVIAGASPIQEDFFFMSFRGMESSLGPFTETVQSSHGDLLWETTPYQNPWNDRYDAQPHTNCWLGDLCQ
jgi:hypothetical protein